MLTSQGRSNLTATVVLVGTLDTKGLEYAYLRDRLREHGVDVLVVDAGVLGESQTSADVCRDEVARAGGRDIEELRTARNRALALETMTRGASMVVERLHAEGKLDAIAGLGGTGGSTVVTAVMRRLPVGVPKLMVSTVASGDTRGYVAGSDVTMHYPVVDIAGINRITATMLANAAGAIGGMATAARPELDEARPLLAASMFGITTPCVNKARELLEELGYEVVVFHQTGVGGQSLEELVRSGFVAGVLDVTTTELADEVAGGLWPAGANRLETAGRLGVPQVVSLGALDFVNVGPLAAVPERFRGRTFYEHTPEMAGMRTSAAEAAQVARRIAAKLNAAQGPTALFVPLRGTSLLATEGKVFHDVGADDALFSELRERVDRKTVELHELETDVNDPAFAMAMANRLHDFCELPHA
jgi:uncharacterized protein (UPF0261 family)